MLFITGLLTLLAIAQAGGDHVKGGLRVKGGSVSQEKVAQDSIIPSPFNVKTAPYGTKVTREEVGDPDGRVKGTYTATSPRGIQSIVQYHADDTGVHATVKTSQPNVKTASAPIDAASKTAHMPSLHHSVKTAPDASGVHPAATSPVAQDQIHTNAPTSSRGIKTLKTAATGKTRFSQGIRDPVAHPVVQTQQKTDDPAAGTITTLKTAPTGKTRFHQGVRDPVAHPVVQTQQKTDDPAAGTIKTLKTAATGKTRFHQGVRDPVAHPVVQTQQKTDDPAAGTIKTLKTAATGKTRFHQGVRDPVAHPVVQTQQKTDDPAAGTIKTLKTAATGKTRFHQGVRDPVAHPVVQTQQKTDDPAAGTIKSIKTLKTAATGKTRFSQDDPIAHPVVQTIKTVQHPSGRKVIRKTVKTLDRAADTSSPRTKTAVKTAQPSFNSQRTIPAPVTASRTNTITTSTYSTDQSSRGDAPIRTSSASGQITRTQSGGRIGSADRGGGLILDQDTLQTLQNAGGVVINNGEISLNEIGLEMLKTIRGGSDYGTTVQGQNIQTATRTIVRNRPQSATGIATAPQTVQTRQVTRQRTPQRGTVTSYTQTSTQQQTSSRGSTAGIAGSHRTAGASAGVVGQRTTTGSQTVLFDGREISLSGAREGQHFDENLQPILPGGGTAGDGQTATRTVVRTRQQSVSSIPEAPKPVQTRPVTRQRQPQRGTLTGYTQTTTQRQTISGASGAGIAGGSRTVGGPTGVVSQRTTTGSQSVLFNGKEISLSGAREGQLFDENLQPILPGGGTAGAGQTATRTVVRTRQQSVSSIPEAPKPVQMRPVTRQRQPQRGTLTGYTQTTTQRQTISGAGGAGIAGGTRTPGGPTGIVGQRTTTGSQSVLFNGKEISLSGAREGQLFDENLQPILPGGGTAGAGQTTTRTAVRTRQQSVSSIPEAPKPVQTRPVTRQRQPQRGTLTGYTQTTTQRQTISGAGGAGIAGGSRTVGGPTGVVGQRTTTGSQSVLFNGKEISLSGAREGQLFDENLQPILPGGGTAGAGQTATRTVVRTRQQSVSSIPEAPKPVRMRPVTRQRQPQRGTLTGYTQTTTQRQTISGAGGAGIAGGTRTPGGPTGIVGQRTTTGSQSVLFNGKEISLSGAREGQVFDENLQPILPGGGTAGAGQTATRTVVRTRQQSVSSIPEAPKPVQTRPVTRQRQPQRGTLTGYTQTTTQRQTISGAGGAGIAGGSRTAGGPTGVVGQRTTTGSQAVLFNGKEISLSGAREGQLFDENLQPILPGGGTAGAGQTATRTVVRTRQQSLSPIPEAPKPVQTRPVTRQRQPQRGTLTGYTQTTTQRQTISGASGAGIAGGTRTAGGPTAVVGQRTTTGSQAVMFNGKEISLSGAREGQLFDENLQPILPGGGTAGAGQTATRTVVRTRQQSVSSIPEAPKPVQTRPVTRQRQPQRGTLTGYTQTTTQRQTISGAGGAGIAGGTRTPGGPTGVVGQRTTTGSQSVLFNGKEISLSGAREGQLFDENLQPILPGGGTAGAGQTATRTVVRTRQQSVSSIPEAPKPVQTRPVTRQRQPQRGTLTGYTQTTTQRQTISGAGGAGIAGGTRTPGGPTGVVGQRTTTGSQSVLFNGKEISLSGAREGQLFEENLQPILPGGGTAGAGQTATRTVVRTRQQSVSSIPEAPKPVQTRPVTRQRQPQRGTLTGYTQTTTQRQTISGAGGAGIAGGTRTPGGPTGVVGQRTTTGSQSVLFNGKEISLSGAREGQLFDENLQPILPGGGTAGAGQTATRTVVRTRQQSVSSIPEAPKPVQTRPVTRQRQPQRGTLTGYTQTTTQRQTISGAGGAGIAGGTRTPGGPTGVVGQRTTTGSQSVLFNGKEISLSGAREGQLFDENLQPILPGGGTAGAGQTATRTVVRTRQQSVSSIPEAPKPVQTRPVTRQRQPQRGTLTGYTQTTTQRQTISGAGGAGIAGGTRTPGGPTGVVGQRTTTGSQSVLFNGKEISLSGAREGQLFDENLQPILPGGGTAGAGQTATRTVVRTRQQSVSSIPEAPKPVQTRPVTRQRQPQRGTLTGYTQTTTQRQTISGAGGAGIAGGTRTPGGPTGVVGQRTTTGSQSVLFNGKEISLSGAREGQLFDENLQPILPGGGTAGAGQTATRTVVRTRQQSVSSIPEAPKPVQTRPVTRQRQPQRGTLTGYTQTTTQRQTISGAGGAGIAGGTRTPGGPTGVVGQRTTTGSQSVLFNGKEISLSGAREGQLFDENLQPILPGGGTAGAGQTATRTVVRTRQQSVSSIPEAPKPVQTRPVTRQRQPQRGTLTGYTQTTTQRQTISGAGGAGIAGGTRTPGGPTGVVGQRTTTGSQSVLFNGKEISLSGAREGQLFDENLQPILPGGGTAGAGQTATRTVVRTRQQSVSSIPEAPKPVQTRPVTRQRQPQRGTLTGYTQTTTQRQTISGASGAGIAGGTRTAGGPTGVVGQRTTTGSQSVLFNGKEISLSGAREGQLFDENLQPILPGGGTAGAGQTATRTVVRTRQQSVSSIPEAPKPVQTRPVTRQRQPQRGTLTGYTQTTTQRQTISGAGGAGIAGGSRTAGGPTGVVGQRTTTGSQAVLFNGKEISLSGAREGQLFDENLQPILPGGGTAGAGQTATRTVVRTRQQSLSPIPEAPKPVQTRPVTRQRQPQRGTLTGYTQTTTQRQTISGASGAGIAGGTRTAGGPTAVVGQRTTTGSQSVLFNGKEISLSGAREGQLFDENLQPILPGGGTAGAGQTATRTVVRTRQQSVSSIPEAPKPVQTRPVTRQRQPQRGTLTGYTQTTTQRQTISGASGAGIAGGTRTAGGPTGVVGQRTTTGSQSVLFNGKEISLSGAREGQLFDENLQPILPGGGTAGAGQTATRTVVRTRQQSVSSIPEVPKPVQTRPVTRQRQPQRGTLTGYTQTTTQRQRISGASRTRTAGGSAGVVGQRRTTGSQSVLFNGREISLSGAREGQLFDENLQPIVPGGGVSNAAQMGGYSSSGYAQRSFTDLINEGPSPVSPGRARQSVSRHASGAMSSLGYIDVTRSRGSDVPLDMLSIGNPATISRHSSSYGSPGGEISQARVSQGPLESSVIQERQDLPFLSSSDAQQQIHESDPSVRTVPFKASSDPAHLADAIQTQVNIEDPLQQSPLPKPEGFRSVQEQVPFDSSSPGVVSKKTIRKITQVSQKDVDIPTVQQKLLGGDFSEYLPNTSFLPPFNYAPPQLSASRYSVKRPITQEQQKVGQVFV